MDDTLPRIALNLIGPGLIAVLGLGFLWAWLLERKRHYLLALTAACLLFGVGIASQVLAVPRDNGYNSFVSNIFYTSAVLAVGWGLLRRSGRTPNPLIGLAILLLSSGMIWFFYYVDPNLSARVYVQNFGFGAILLLTAINLRELAMGRLVDRVLFWALLVFSVHFFPRTILTVTPSTMVDGRAFGASLFWQVMQLSLAVLGAALVLSMLMAALSDIIEDMRSERDTDVLTGLRNRRSFDDDMRALPIRAGAPLPTLILCDLDYFKQVNDQHGHGVGDAVLRDFGTLLTANMRGADKVYRIGGEEFATIVPGDVSDARRLVERLQGALTDANFPLPDDMPITASFGGATRLEREGFQAWFDRADAALYASKQQGRDRAVFAEDQATKTKTQDDDDHPGLIVARA
ncbi:hypothetical protein WH87_14895 [Devosia epidermidihirudinis]|uniref:diguanylate cyclase n=1 Tax=Devosia epidermidihirudinis TaxID=1293439 RepID=A0A0F5Q4K1_9HYPH|nr:GGDEF domain-containing protein [Devosia epidermidihirudinis]KKC35858.1 hypothetical protein WH87_14895 [Devosia epidermidihirudinis]